MSFTKVLSSLILLGIIIVPSLLMADSNEPCFELLLVDSHGHRVGYDQSTEKTVAEIPNSGYSEDQLDEGEPIVKVVDCDLPPMDSYKLYIIGKTAGTYNITVSAYTTDANSTDQTISGTIGAGEIKEAMVQYSPVVGEATKVFMVDSTPPQSVSQSLNDLSVYPSPFNPNKQKATVQYSLFNAGNVDIAIYDLFGNLVKTFAMPSGGSGAQAGLNQVEWDGRNGQGMVVANGGYIVSVSGDGRTKRFKVLIIK